jgi:hypothetical protein
MGKYKALLFNARFFSALAVAVCLATAAAGAWVGSSAGPVQPKEKLLERGNLIYAADPVKITEIKSSGRAVKLNEKFAGGDDWLKGTALRLKNISTKEIVHIQLDFDFPETGDAGPVMAYQMMLGRRPGTDNPLAAPLSLAPGAETEVSIDEHVYAAMTNLVERRRPLHSINRVKVRIAFVAFADGTGYGAGGTFYRQDPNHPRRYLPVINGQPAAPSN